MKRHAPSGSVAGASALPHRPELRFLVLFALYALVFEVVFVAWGDRTSWFEAYLAFTVRCTEGALRILGIEAIGREHNLTLGWSTIAVRRGCDAVEPTGLFIIGTLLFPARKLHKLGGVVAGGLVLACLNIIRIGTLLCIQRYRPESFLFLHLSVWPVVFMLATLSLWGVWALLGMRGRK